MTIILFQKGIAISMPERKQSKIFPSSKQPVLEFKGGPTFCSKIPKSTKKKTQIPTFYKGVFGLMNPGRSPFACMKPLFEFFFFQNHTPKS